MLPGCTKDPKVIDANLDVEDIIMYSKNPNGHNELYKLENGVESVLLSDPDFDYWWAKVSPNKEKFLVYRSPVNPDKNHDDYEEAELILADINGSNEQVLIDKNQYGWNAQGVCRWNSSGAEILMCAEVETPAGFQWRLVRTNADGDDPIILSDRWALDCNFSDSNEEILFMGFDNNNLSFDLTNLELQIGDYDVASNKIANIRSLTSNNTRDHDPSFSPDGSKIVFSAGNAIYSNVDIVVYDLATESEIKLVDDASANGGSMCWSTDGKFIYFHTLTLFSAPFHIRRVEVATGTVTTLLRSPDNNFGFIHPEAY